MPVNFLDGKLGPNYLEPRSIRRKVHPRHRRGKEPLLCKNGTDPGVRKRTKVIKVIKGTKVRILFCTKKTVIKNLIRAHPACPP
jgi:hypothetical protein